MIAEQREQIEALQDCPPLNFNGFTIWHGFRNVNLLLVWRKPMALRSVNCRCLLFNVGSWIFFRGWSQKQNKHMKTSWNVTLALRIMTPGPGLAVFRHGDSVVLVTQLADAKISKAMLFLLVMNVVIDRFWFRNIQMERYFKVIQVITLVGNKVWKIGNCTKIIADSMLCQFVERELHGVCQIDSCDNCWLLAVAIAVGFWMKRNGTGYLYLYVYIYT